MLETGAVPEPLDIGVVIVTYNSSGVVAECLRSVTDELGPDGDVVVVDNASTDGTAALVRRIAPRARVVDRPGNGGFAAGVNAGFAAVDPSRAVLVLNPDARLRPGAVAVLRAALEGPGAGIAVPMLLDVDGHLHLSLRRSPRVTGVLAEAVIGGTAASRIGIGEMLAAGAAYRSARSVDWATGAAWMVSAACRAALGPLDERYFLYSEETEYMLRAGDRGFRVRYEPAAVVEHLGGEQSTSHDLWALSVANRSRLHRERYGAAAGLGMRLASGLNEAVRAVSRGRDGGARHRGALRELVGMRRWPDPPGRSRPVSGYVCFSAQDWWYHNQAHSDFQLMRALAARHRVLVVNSIGMRMPTPGRSSHVLRRVVRKLRSVAKLVRRPLPDLPNFVVMSPLPLPFYGSPTLRRVNAVVVRAQVGCVSWLLGIHKPAIVVTIPTAWDVVRPMSRTGVVFNRSDRHSAFPEADRAVIEAMERDLLTHADRVLYVSRSLQHDERELSGERAHFLDHGVDVDHFARRPESEIPADLAAIPGPRVGFFGALDDFVVDFDLLGLLAEQLPTVSIVLVGSADGPVEELVARHPNVHWLGFRPYGVIPAYGSGFDVAIMPWRDTEWIRHANPIKLKEYLALGLPVVTTAFDEVESYRDRVMVADGPEQFVRAVRTCLEVGGPLDPAELRESVRSASWSARSEELDRIVASIRP